MNARQSTVDIRDYRHDATRKNNPPAAIAGEGKLPSARRQRYSYNPHLPPVLRFDDTGSADRLHELINKATQEPLSPEDAKILSDALQNSEPWLEWTGKREQSRWFEVDPVALHTHERVSAHAAVRIAARQDVQRDLFADPGQPYHEAVQFYQHEVGWANRMILGDSLTVMNSLATRESLAGQVQMIYMDPPYGINFKSNFQPFVRDRDVTEKEENLARQPEVVKAYRDTWTLGLHSYLSYLRDRIAVARDLLTDSGSLFVQISDMNVHNVRLIMDEVFGSENFVSEIVFTKTRSLVASDFVTTICDFILWYAKDRTLAKDRIHKLLVVRSDESMASHYENDDGQVMTKSKFQMSSNDASFKPFKSDDLRRKGNRQFDVEWHGVVYRDRFRTNAEGMARLLSANRIHTTKSNIRYKFFLEDYPASPLNHLWDDVIGAQSPVFAVQTNETVVQRCLLMSTCPGDLVLDPTCGSGTTARVAEEWGRRWITIDTSRVAVALARQKLLTSRFDYYETSDGTDRINESGFKYKTIPHVTLRDIARNEALDPIFEKWTPIMDTKLESANIALLATDGDARAKLLAKFEHKRRARGPKNRITDADERRWKLPSGKWEHWEVPFDADEDYPDALRIAVEDYRATWRARMAEVNACIEANAEQEVLVDQPEIRRGVVRVSGPFTVESVHPPEDSIGVESPIGGAPEDLSDFDQDEPTNADASIESLVRLLREDGVRFPDNKEMRFARLDVLKDGSLLHAEGAWHNGHGDASRRVAVSFGPRYGPVTAKQVEDALRSASRTGYDELLLAGFGFDGAAQAAIQDDPNPNVRLHMAHISPDVNMGDLLKQTRNSQLFSVSGAPRTKLDPVDDGKYVVEMEGVDVYDPVDNSIRSEPGNGVPAWFLDSDYDGRTFCITQAFFPKQDAWKNLARDLTKFVDPDTFETFKGTRSLPFAVGEHRRVAVKVIDPRGNEVMSVLDISEDENG